MIYTLEEEFKYLINKKSDIDISYYLIMDYSNNYNKLVEYIDSKFKNQYTNEEETVEDCGVRHDLDFIAEECKQVAFRSNSLIINILDIGFAEYLDGEGYNDYIIMG